LNFSWVSVGATLALAVFTILLRLRPARDRHGRGKAASGLLVTAALLELATNAAAGAGASALVDVLGILTIFCLVCGVTGVLAMLIFDIAAPRARIRIPSILRDLIQAAAVFVIAIVVLRRSGVDLMSLVTTSAVVTAVVGLALQSTIANVFASLALELDRSFDLGDWIQVGGHIGRIAEISWRSTQIVTRDGDTVIVPNVELLSHEVLNFSKPQEAHRMSMRVGFHYRHPPNEVREVLLGVARGTPGVLETRPPDCFPVEWGESAITYALRYWIADLANDSAIDGDLRGRIWYASRRAGLEIPFLIRTVVVEPPPAERTVDEEKAERRYALDAIDIFAPLRPAEREHLANALRREQFGRGEQIVRQGDPGTSLYLIRSGEVAVDLAEDGARREIARLQARDFFGEMSLMTGAPHVATCTAKSDAVCYVVQYAALRPLLGERPEIAEELSTLLAKRTAMLDDHRDGLSAEVRARRAADARSNLLARIRDFFHLH
jgi:small-conductance mechanosensitive channel/CRP-like cAMP-binding protein